MNKTLIITVGAVIVIGLLSLAYWITGSSPQQASSNPSAVQNAGFPVAPSVAGGVASSSTAQGGIIPVAGSGGAAIQMLDFLKDPTTVKDPLNPGYYYLGYHPYEGVPDPTATATPPYVIAYESDTQSFNITLLQEPIGPVREEMQQYLMAHLGITQEQMCQINYMVSVPWRVNQLYSSKNLGFSFCPGATALPK